MTCDLQNTVSSIEEAAPSLIVLGQLGEVKEVFLVAESQIICKINPNEAPILLLGAFYAFNMAYPKGLETMYTFLEHIQLSKKLSKMSTLLCNFITTLKTDCCK